MPNTAYSLEQVELTYSKYFNLDNGLVNAALVDAAQELIHSYPMIPVGQIWKDLYKVHVKLKVVTLLPQELSVIFDNSLSAEAYPLAAEAFKSADQSWLRSSGVAFENICKNELNPFAKPLGVTFYTPGELVSLLSTPGALEIDTEDRQYFLKAVKEHDFDLFITLKRADKEEIFGFVQCKTSIRDRIQENTRTSQIAMDNHFWSIVIALDEDGYLKLPKFNTIAKTFWNGFYVVSNEPTVDGSIFPTALTGATAAIIAHLSQAVDTWSHRRHRMTSEWRPSLD